MQKTVCPECGTEYSSLRASCPHCGAKKKTPSDRTPTTSDAVRSGTSANARAAENSKWQLIFGLCIVAAVIIAVIVLILTTINGSYDSPVASASPTPS
ncbi:MAG: hypothetical protein RSD68_05535, partial [Oscillospiraceae bacterium]